MDRMRVLYAATTHDRLRSYPFNLLLGLYNYMGRFACFPNKKTRIVGPFICRQKRIVAQFQFHDRSLVFHITIDLQESSSQKKKNAESASRPCFGGLIGTTIKELTILLSI